MPGHIIGLFSCLLCALPFFYLAWEGKQKNAAVVSLPCTESSFRHTTFDSPPLTTSHS